MLSARIATRCPSELRSTLARYLAGEISAEVALMQFILQRGGAGALTATVEGLAAAAPERAELADLARLAAANSNTIAQLATLLERGLADLPPAGGDAIAAFRGLFDRAVAAAPEASVALYSLGSAEILDRATDEITARLREWELLGPDRLVLDIGCGIGRIERALAPYVDAVTGIDLSPGMIDEARRRCRGLANVTLQTCTGRGLAGFAARSFDLVLAIDSFPYIVAAGPRIAERHIADTARLLRPGGALAIFNYSYRGAVELDRRDVDRLAAEQGLAVRRAGTQDLALWDGVTFLLTPRVR